MTKGLCEPKRTLAFSLLDMEATISMEFSRFEFWVHMVVSFGDYYDVTL